MTNRSVITGVVLALMLGVASPSQGGGLYSCRRPVNPLVGDYVIHVVAANPAQVRLVEAVLADLRRENPDVYAKSTIAIDVDAGNELTPPVPAEVGRHLYIGVGDASEILKTFEMIGAVNAVSVPKYVSNEKALSEAEYNRALMTHAVYRGLLQLNGEQRQGISEVTLEHAIGTQAAETAD